MPKQFRLNRGGNRQINAAIYRIAIAEARMRPDAMAYIERRFSAGKSRHDAIRTLCRKLSSEVYKRLLVDERARNHIAVTSTEAILSDLAA